MSEPEWTLDELVAQVAAALADGYVGPADRRARQVPDRRAVRWYTTIGVLDRPAVRGRTGWYGERHLLQVVAVKRLQAAGRSLSEIQAELTGADDSTLRRIADLPARTAASPKSPPEASRALAAAPGPSAVAATGRFWTRRPVQATPDQDLGHSGVGHAGLRYAVELAEGVTVLVSLSGDAPVPDQRVIAAIRAGAQPLLDVLAQLGLTTCPEGHNYGEGENP